MGYESEYDQGGQPDMSAADFYRALHPDEPRAEAPAQLENFIKPEVTLATHRLASIEDPDSDTVVGALEAAKNGNGPEVQLTFAEARTNGHNQIAEELWGNEHDPGLQKVIVGGHEVEMATRYSLEPHRTGIIVFTTGDCNNEPAHALVKQTYVDLGLKLINHPDNEAPQLPVNIFIQEGGNPPVETAYTREQLTMLKNPGREDQQAA